MSIVDCGMISLRLITVNEVLRVDLIDDEDSILGCFINIKLTST